MGYSCCVRTCRNTQKDSCKMYSFPTNSEASERWRRLIGREDLDPSKLKNYRVCSVHFSKDSVFPMNRNRTNLKVGSVPSLYLPDVPVTSTSNATCRRDSVKSSNFNKHNGFPLSTTYMNNTKEQESDVPVIDVSRVRSKQDNVKNFNCDHFNDFLSTPTNIRNAEEQEMVLVLSDVTLSDMSRTIHGRDAVKNLNCYNFFDFPSTPTNINNSKEHEMDMSSQLCADLTDNVIFLKDNEDIMIDSLEQDLNSLECVKQELCRVCGKNTSSLLPIFDKSQSDLVKLLEMYLPLKIAENDTYPMNICLQCHDSLHKWHELYVTCLAADKAFKTTFDCKKSQDPKDVTNIRICAEEEAGISSNLITRGEGVIVSHGNKEQIHENDVIENTSDDFLNDVSEIFKTDMYVYKCKFCNEQFKKLRDMNIHYKLCRLDPTICEICGKPISQQKQLFKHKLKYHNKRTFSCEKCGENINIHSLTYHMETVHSLFHYCDLCCKSLHSNPVYKLHMKKHGMGKKKSTFKIVPVAQNGKFIYVCPVCGQIFNKSTILTHLTKPCSVKCSACVKNLKNEKQLILHSCEKWKCQFCSKSFLNKRKWCEHERIHTGEKPYKCHYCDTTFRRIRQRSAHHKMHCAVSFECQFCYKKFRFLQLLRNHIRTHDHKHAIV